MSVLNLQMPERIELDDATYTNDYGKILVINKDKVSYRRSFWLVLQV